MLEIMLCIVLLPVAVAAVAFTGALVVGTVKGFAQVFKKKT